MSGHEACPQVAAYNCGHHLSRKTHPTSKTAKKITIHFECAVIWQKAMIKDSTHALTLTPMIETSIIFPLRRAVLQGEMERRESCPSLRFDKVEPI
jgi:hypothetical protein